MLRNEGGIVDGDRRRQTVVVAVAAMAALIAALWFWWPLGVVLGVVLGTTATVLVAGAMQRAEGEPQTQDVADLFGSTRSAP